jgi:hypothetical protein
MFHCGTGGGGITTKNDIPFGSRLLSSDGKWANEYKENADRDSPEIQFHGSSLSGSGCHLAFDFGGPGIMVPG